MSSNVDAGGCAPLAKLPAQILQGDVASVPDLPSLERLDEVRVAQPLPEPALVNEELHELGVGRVMRQDALEDDEPLAARVLRQEDLGHAAERQGADDSIATKVIFSRGYGFADREAGTPMTQDTLVQIAVLSHTSGIPASGAWDTVRTIRG